MSSSSSSSSSSKSTYEEENDTTNSTDTMTTEQIFKGMERRNKELELAEADGSLQRAKEMHVDDLSSDDEEAGALLESEQAKQSSAGRIRGLGLPTAIAIGVVG